LTTGGFQQKFGDPEINGCRLIFLSTVTGAASHLKKNIFVQNRQ
jgi:hypothetical protein